MGSTPIGRAILCIDLIYIREVAQLGRALGLGPRVAGSNPVFPTSFDIGGLAQLGERLLCTQEVSGSIPSLHHLIINEH